LTESRATLESGESAEQAWPWSRLRRDIFFFLIALVVIALDQITKHIVRSNLGYGETAFENDLFRIINVTNTGAAFGILQGKTIFLTITTLLGLGAILLYYLYPPMEHPLLRVALGLQLGGAVGNLIDRVRLGGVTDFIDFRHWPTFNVADSAISVGVTTIVVFFLLDGTLWRREEQA
jgi:signal peptidase II